MKVGDKIKSIQGVEFPNGGEIVKIENEYVYVKPLDADYVVKINMGYDFDKDYDHYLPDNSFYDPKSMHSPELDNIRSLPLWWGPRDPNMPSHLTRVIWQPINYMNRNLQRRWGMQRRAFSYPKTFPTRARLDRWVESDDDLFTKEELIALSGALWDAYITKQHQYSPIRGRGGSTPFYRFALAFMREQNLSPEEILFIFEFMVAVGIIPEFEYIYLLDTLDSAMAYYLDK